MPETRREHFKPIAIWTVISTGIILSMIKVFGDGFLMSHDINVRYPYIEQDINELKEMHKNCEEKMDMLIIDVHSHHNRLDSFERRVLDCENGLDDCERAHRKYHHGMKD